MFEAARVRVDVSIVERVRLGQMHEQPAEQGGIAARRDGKE